VKAPDRSAIMGRVRQFSALVIFCPILLAPPWAAAQTGVAASPPSRPPLSQPVIEVAAFRVAPVKPGARDGRLKAVSLEDILSLPAPAAGGEKELETRVQAAETWPEILRRVSTGLKLPPADDVAPAQTALLPPLQPGKFLRARSPASGPLEVTYVVKPDEAYTITVRGGLAQVTPHAADPRIIERMQADPSKASLFTATNAIGLPESIALQLTEIFAGEVDFHRELHQGYRCALVYEAHYREGFIERSGRILAVELDVGSRRFQAYFSRDTQGRDAYFDQTGKTTRRMFRRSPVEFTHITSEYTLARFHPILGIWRAHRGVDYAAPMGAKVMAVAEGVVEFAGARGDYGNLVVLRHQDAFLTWYGHLSEFAPGLIAGGKVEQGQVIGLVGMTGLATGPHLHFEFHARDASGAWQAVPAPDIIEATVVAAPNFAEVVREYRTKLSVAESIKFVSLD
jgi:murein DD-endopeptidase MepM/ murein hydrolase activator NlpD